MYDIENLDQDFPTTRNASYQFSVDLRWALTKSCNWGLGMSILALLLALPAFSACVLLTAAERYAIAHAAANDGCAAVC